MERVSPLNRRKESRYFIEGISIEGIGTIVEVSKNGLRILKDPAFSLKDPELKFMIASVEFKGRVKWEDELFIGVEGPHPLGGPAFLEKRIKRVKEALPPPQWMIVPEKAVVHYKKSEGLVAVVNLLLELESEDPDIRKLADLIERVSQYEEGEREKALEAGTEPSEALKKSCKDELRAQILQKQPAEEMGKIDAEFAISLLGLQHVREVIENHVRKCVFDSDQTLPLFENLETFNVLKSVFYKKLCRLFGLTEHQSEGSTLLFFETAGLDILVKESNGILDNFYKSPTHLYSELSRIYEQVFFSVDALHLTQKYFERTMGDLKESYDGYLMAYLALHPQYQPAKAVKITPSRKALALSYLFYLTFLAVLFILDKNQTYGNYLSRRLQGRGLTSRNQDDLIEQTIEETQAILQILQIRRTIPHPQTPDDFFSLDTFLGKDIRFEYLLKTFRAFGRNRQGRLALRYEDGGYAHYILGKLINAGGLGLAGKTLAVIPCGNLSEEQWYQKDFDLFDLLVFKEIHKLPQSKLGSFLRLWNGFEGQAIATFSTFEFLEHSQAQLFGHLREWVVDFPSYFQGAAIQDRMIDHTLDYLRPFIGEQTVNREKYRQEPFTMNHIKAEVLTTLEIG
jgi:hypothetical protein